jgi:dihydropyrimidinase
LAKTSAADYGLHGVIQHVDEEILGGLDLLRGEGVSSVKIYLTYAYKIDDESSLKLFKRAKELGMTVCVHCEDDDLLSEARKRLVQKGLTSPRCHGESRPPEAEGKAVARILEIAKKAGDARVYIVHLSTALGLNAITQAREAGQENIFAETCPQYLFLDESRYKNNDALKYIMSPPLRSPSDIEALWEGLKSGRIQTIGTDHCPFFYKTQKMRGAEDFALCPNGAPGVELRMQLMFSEGFMKGKLTLPEVAALCCANPAKIFGLGGRKGEIAVGCDADFVLFDSSLETTASAASLHENVDYTPYEGMKLKGSPTMTILRGNIASAKGSFTGSSGSGCYLKRRAV